MSNVIQFLESAGRNTKLSPADYIAGVAALDVADAQRQALLDRDHAGLNELLDGRPKMFLLINTPSPDDHEAIPDDDKDGNGVPDEEEPPYEKE